MLGRIVLENGLEITLADDLRWRSDDEQLAVLLNLEYGPDSDVHFGNQAAPGVMAFWAVVESLKRVGVASAEPPPNPPLPEGAIP